MRKREKDPALTAMRSGEEEAGDGSSLLDISGYTTLSSSLQSRTSVLLLEDAFPSCEDISFPPPFQVHTESLLSLSLVSRNLVFCREWSWSIDA